MDVYIVISIVFITIACLDDFLVLFVLAEKVRDKGGTEHSSLRDTRMAGLKKHTAQIHKWYRYTALLHTHF